MANNDSGTIRFENDETIVYDSSQYGSWRLVFSDICVMGEYTNQNGPFLDDYFFVFVTEDDGSWFEASFYADGRETILKLLGEKTQTYPKCDLVGETDFRSHVWFPTELAGMPLFDFRKEGLFGKLGLENKQYLAPEVIEYIKTLKGS